MGRKFSENTYSEKHLKNSYSWVSNKLIKAGQPRCHATNNFSLIPFNCFAGSWFIKNYIRWLIFTPKHRAINKRENGPDHPSNFLAQIFENKKLTSSTECYKQRTQHMFNVLNKKLTDGEVYYFCRLKIRKIGHHQLDRILHFYD